MMSAISNKKRVVSIISAFCLALFLIHCDSTDDGEVDQADLMAMNQEIIDLATSVSCVDSSDWSITAWGSKACGGPSGYIAFSKQIDTLAFLAKVEKYTQAVREYNEQNGVISDCAIEPMPIDLVCREGEVELVYSRCELIPDSGPCEAAIPRYYFDQETQECKEFLWGGCDGKVPFETLEECKICE